MGLKTQEVICRMDLEEVGKGKSSIAGVDGWVSGPGH